MFLFTSLPTPPESKATVPGTAVGGGAVVDAIRDGSTRTGADFDYLLKTAQRESALDPAAKAKASSATGLFQFIEQTWLGMVKGAGPEHGLGDYAQAISASNGRYDVADPALKQQILQLRNDPRTAAVMAGELTRRNAQTLAGALGRQPTDGELYAAHFMGAAGAADLIRLAQAKPAAAAADLFPDQASANRAIFYDKASGRAKSVSEVYASLVSEGAGAAVPNLPQLKSDPSTWMVGQADPAAMTGATAYAHADGPAMHSLFRTEGQHGPLNATVQKIWSGIPARAIEEDAKRYFPRSGDLPAQGATTKAAPSKGIAADVPLPRPRPTSQGGAAETSATRSSGTTPPPGQRPRASLQGERRAGGAPLDLLAFMKKDPGTP